MSERCLEVTRLQDGSFVATFADDRPPAAVAGWEDIRRLRHRYRLNDHWVGDRDSFIAAHGHPFDDWFMGLSQPCRDALIADPSGVVPAEYAEEVKRSLRRELGRDGLRVEGSVFSAQVRAYLVQRASDRVADTAVENPALAPD